MAKYHISPNTGEPKRCLAEIKQCPVGGMDNHYPTMEAAREAYESQMKGSEAGVSREDQLAAAYEAKSRTRMEDFTAEPSRTDLMEAGAYAKANNTYAMAHYEVRPGSVTTPAYQDYDGTGVFYETVEERSYLIATPQGEFVRVSLHAGIDGEIDNGWEYSPRLSMKTEFFPTATAVRKGEPSETFIDDRSIEGENEYLRDEDRHGSSWPSYSHHDLDSTRRAAEKLLRIYGLKPWNGAYVATMRASKKKLDPAKVEGHAGSADPLVRECAALRKELPKTSHYALATDEASDVRVAFAKRSDLNDGVLESMLDRPSNAGFDYDDWSVRNAVFTSPSASGRLQKKWARALKIDDLKKLATSRTLDPEARKIIETRAGDLGIRFAWNSAR